MRWWRWMMALAMATSLAGCPGDRDEPAAPTFSILTFRYDAARDVVIASTATYQPARGAAPDYLIIAGTPQAIPPAPAPSAPMTPAQTRALSPLPFTPQQYANALARLPDVNYAPSPGLRLANPQPTVAANVITVNYREAEGLEALASAQVTAITAALEAWWWVPGVTEMRLLVRGQPVTQLGPAVVTQPLTRPHHTYVVHPLTGEVGYLVGSLNPATLTQAVEIVRRRDIREFPATQGFRPLLPPDVTITAQTDRVADGVLPVDLSANFPLVNRAQLAGMVLMFTQFPQVDAVRFTFGGQTVDQPFMRGSLRLPITPHELILPQSVATVAAPQVQRALEQAAADTLGGAPAAAGTALVWRDWALLAVTPRENVAEQWFVFQRAGDTFTVKAFGTVVPLAQLIRQGMPVEAITALRLPGWEMVE